MAEALLELDTKRAYIVSSHDGMDELSLSGNSSFAYVEDNRISEGEINPEVLGFKIASKEAIQGGDATVNAQITRDVFSGVETGAKRDIIVLNAAFALFVDGNVRDIDEAIAIAKEGLDSGNATMHLEKIVKFSQTV